MLRRALLWLLPAVLVLAFALPAPRAIGAYATAIERCADAGPGSLTSIAFLPHDRATGFSPWSELDDDDRIVQAGAVPAWPLPSTSVPSGRTSDLLRCTYSISAAFARGPPSA